MAGAKAAMAFVFKTLSRQDARAQMLVDYVDEIYAALIFVLERSKRVLTTLSHHPSHMYLSSGHGLLT